VTQEVLAGLGGLVALVVTMSLAALALVCGARAIENRTADGGKRK
jgi:hypothetical protein